MDTPRNVTPTTATAGIAHAGTAAQLAAASISANTQRAYAGAMRRLAEHLGGAELSDATLAAALAAMFDAGRSVSVYGGSVAMPGLGHGGSRYRQLPSDLPGSAREAS